MSEWEHRPCGTVMDGGQNPPLNCRFCATLLVRVQSGGEGWRLISRKHLEQEPRGPRRPSPSLRRRVYERDEYCCVDCGSDDREQLTADHKIPWSKGGPTTYENLQTMCRECNLAKGNDVA